MPVLEPFGAIALRKGYITSDELEKALRKQEEEIRCGKRRLIGMILLSDGTIDNNELLDILRDMEVAKKLAHHPAK
jgi:hypothetical protein